MGSCDDCPLRGAGGSTSCYLLVPEEGKTNVRLADCLASLQQPNVSPLSGLFLRRVDLRGLVVSNKRIEGADLSGADLRGAVFNRVTLHDCLLNDADFENAVLQDVDFRGAKGLRGLLFYNAIALPIRLPDLDELELPCAYEQKQQWPKAEYVYRILKESYRTHGMNKYSGFCYEREMEMQRRQARGWEWLALTVLWLSCGYGERPERTVVSALLIILGFALAYTNLTLVGSAGDIHRDLAQALYFSVITFSTTGYGDIHPQGWAQVFAASEALVGSFTIALFVFVFCRRMTR
ncbi:ion channel [Gloeobacter kilaueensis]|uniref:Potassium channel protein n=1 Tax=Gloeobacter kilaueensis (strain ATCC BAA-2537 / CCAP 1431/1 / ULC 316 / JS1) TaxID=1183438 RepID=U5QMG5_GLOK1|nr:ion channel [Gloeobacter kilaueensis]AGY58830.1 potassium channel protein [Gloeobacter kilaueensis JS1]